MRKRWLLCSALGLVWVLGTEGPGPAAAAPAAQEPSPTTRPPLSFAVGYERVQAFAEAARLDLDYLPGEVVVKFRGGVNALGHARALRGLRSRPPSSGLHWVGTAAILRDYTELDPDILVRQLRLQPEVEWAEPVYLRKARAVPTDPSYATRQWNLSSIGMADAWAIQPTAGRNVIVAIIDTGVTTVNETMTFATWNGSAVQAVAVPVAVSPDIHTSRLLPGRDFVFMAGGHPVLDLDGHGTHVASTVGQEANNGLSGVGLAYGATIMPLKVCLSYWDVQITHSEHGLPGYVPSDSGGCPTTAIADAIRYAVDHGAKVINLSLGGPDESQLERDAIAYAIARGALVVAAAGNGFEDGNTVDYPAGFAATIPGLISVGAVGRTHRRAFYSSTGPHVEVVAPGGDLREGGRDAGIWQTTLRFADINPSTIVFPRFDRYEEDAYQGTSMAVPHVSGLAAMLIAHGITRPVDLETVITRTARDIGATGRDDQHGFGLIQPRAALFGLGIRR